MRTRQHLRVPIPLPVRIKPLDSGQDFELVRIEDISWGGIFVRRDPPLPVGTRLLIQFLMRDDSVALEIWGTVVRALDAKSGRVAGNGVQFQDMDDHSRSLIQKMVYTLVQPLFQKR